MNCNAVVGEARKLSVSEHENLCNWNMSQSENCFINYVLSYIVKSLTCKIAKRIKYTKKNWSSYSPESNQIVCLPRVWKKKKKHLAPSILKIKW